jgi:hypothetical protein
MLLPYPSCLTRRIAAPVSLLCILVYAACGSTDAGPLMRPLAGAAGESAGSGGSGDVNAAGTGGAGRSGSGGDGAVHDAGPDATSDAAPEHSCVVSTLDAYCAAGSDYCPTTYADARAHLRSLAEPGGAFILQQFCSAPDGSQRVQVSGLYGALSLTYIYDPATVQLVSVHISNDSEICSSSLERGDASFDWFAGFYGPDLPNCAVDSAHFELPPQCAMPSGGGTLDAGTVRDAGADAGLSEDGDQECILAP